MSQLMKAAVLSSNNIIEIRQIPKPVLKRNEVLIEVANCGICSSDHARVFNNGAYFYPIILGHEFSGIIRDTYNNKDKSLIGKHVVVFPLIPCKKCDFCRKKMFAQCENYDYFGSRKNGAMTELISVPKWNIKILPDDMNLEVAALCEPTSVAINAIDHISKNIKNVCISGTGTIGILCGLILKSKNYNVAFIVRNSIKVSFLKKLGFNNFIEQSKKDKYECLIECVGTNDSISNCITLLKSQGELILIGNPSTDLNIDKNIYWKILRSEITIKGIWNSKFKNKKNDNWDKAIEYLYSNTDTVKNLITDKFNFKEGINAYKTMLEKNALHIKGVFSYDK